MALHRDIYWLGLQWAVTGSGIQACDQRGQGKFDIGAARLWEEGLADTLRGLSWFRIDEFEKALAAARKHFPQPPPPTSLPAEGDWDLISATVRETGGETGLPCDAANDSKPAAELLNLRVSGWPAKFMPQWRIRISPKLDSGS